MTIGERIKKVRKSLELTQQGFADQIGSKRNTIATYEMGRTEPSSAVISLVCTKFNVSETWLRTGEGEMFLPKADTALDWLAAEHSLTRADYHLVEKFLGLMPESRKTIIEYIQEVAVAISDEEDFPCSAPAPASAVEEAEKLLTIDEQVELYRRHLLLEEERAKQA